MRFKPFPELTDVLLNSAKPLADTDKHYLEGAVYSPKLGFRRSFPQAIKSPRPQETKSSHSSNVIVITALQRDK